MKRILPVFLVIMFALTGCAWMGKLTDSTGHNLSAYGGGRISYPVVKKVLKAETMKRLEVRYDKFLADTMNVVVIEPTQSQEFFNDLILIMAADTSDPYAILNDLTFMLTQFGAEFAGEGTDLKLVGIQPVPRSLYQSYSLGWIASRNMGVYTKE